MAKRANGEGTIRKRSDGRWEGRYYDPIADKQKSVYGKTQKEVREKLLNISKEISDGAYINVSDITVTEWFDIWLTQFIGNVKPLTKVSYETQCKGHIKQYIGNQKLKALTVQHIQNMYNSLSKGEDGRAGLSPKTIKNIHGVLHKSLEQAVKNGYIKHNPSEACVLPKVYRKEIHPLSEQDIQKFIIAIQDDRFKDVFLFALFTGMRQGEILGLTWDCVDFDNGIIYIRRQLQKERQKNAKYYFSSLKNDRPRMIAPAPSVFEILKKRQKRQNDEKLLMRERWVGDSLSDDFVFTDNVGKHLTPHTIYNHYKDIAKDIGIPDSRFHDLRHSYAVISLQNGDDVKTVQEALGHHTAAFTLDVYGHVSQTMRKESANRMENFISGLRK